ncbi:endonuclease-reverse transcriptase [Elysia marginata]|uniref:Endonuclease-reverse transcriptase n=1 Tax=Elysia marginata TaxID=1093978 RepID=A0AAV4IGP5_9GAST|nr:endonuclease-reverse transcriptase [Elysia marginata]
MVRDLDNIKTSARQVRGDGNVVPTKNDEKLLESQLANPRIKPNHASIKEAQIRIKNSQKTRQKFWENKGLLRRNIGPNNKKRILACYVFSVFNYGCEAWTYSKTVQKKIQTFPSTGKKNNKEIIQMTDVCERLLQQLMKRKFGYAGHIMEPAWYLCYNYPQRGKLNGREDREGQEGAGWMMLVKGWSGSTR